MLKTLIIKEFKNILKSPKFTVTLATCSVLILLSIFVGIREYRIALRDYEAGLALNQQDLSEKTNWMTVVNRVHRKPDPMQVFVLGIQNDIGKLATVSTWGDAELQGSAYSQDLVYAAFRFLDFNFIVVVVLSLFAILFTYDVVSGERETGMLKLVFSNSIPRSTYILSKMIGSWAGLAIPLIIPILLGVLLLVIGQVPLQTEHWMRIGALMAAGMLYFTFFIALGVFVSAVTMRSSTSFLVLLVVWVALAFVIPRIGIMISGQLLSVPTASEIDSQIEGFSKTRWEKFEDDLKGIWDKRNREVMQQPEKDRPSYRDRMEWSWAEEDQNLRQKIREDIEAYTRRVKEDMDNRKSAQVSLGLVLSRWSPASLFQLAAMRIAETDVFLKSRYDQSLRDYHKAFAEVIEEKRRQSKADGLRITVDQNGFRVQTPDLKKTIDASAIPQFVHPKLGLRELLAASLIDYILLLVMAAVVFLAALVAFLRYDMR